MHILLHQKMGNKHQFCFLCCPLMGSDFKSSLHKSPANIVTGFALIQCWLNVPKCAFIISSVNLLDTNLSKFAFIRKSSIRSFWMKMIFRNVCSYASTLYLTKNRNIRKNQWTDNLIIYLFTKITIIFLSSSVSYIEY